MGGIQAATAELPPNPPPPPLPIIWGGGDDSICAPSVDGGLGRCGEAARRPPFIKFEAVVLLPRARGPTLVLPGLPLKLGLALTVPPAFGWAKDPHAAPD